MRVSAEKAVSHTSWREENTRYSLKMMLVNSNTKYFRTLKSLATEKKMELKAKKMSTWRIVMIHSSTPSQISTPVQRGLFHERIQRR